MKTVTYPKRPTWIEIDPLAVRNNISQLRRQIASNCRLMAVVKANGYGHGLQEIGKIIDHCAVDYFAVATLSEAIELRTQVTSTPILVLGYTPHWLAVEAVEQRVTLTVFDLEDARGYDKSIRNLSTIQSPLKVHIKVNSGMNRLGAKPTQAHSLLSALTDISTLQVEGIFTHFATSDERDKSFAYEQFNRFHSLLERLDADNLRPPLAHAANSAALLSMPETHLDMVRSGIALYGLHPDPDATPLPPSFQPVMSWKAMIAQVTQLEEGESVSYGQEFIATKPMRVATIPVGYADGFPRRPHTYGSVLIHGEQAPILGRVCMDQTVVDVTAIDEKGPVRQGDEVVLIGKQGRQEITVDQVAQQLKTNNYDVVSRILGRVPRLLLESSTD